VKNFELNIISSVPSPKEILFLDDRIYEHNVLATNRADGTLFLKSIYDDTENIVAGITGWTWAGACEITLFWVKSDYRKKGYGKALLNAAEAEAAKQNCNTIFLRTYSFQAPHFYLKHGYLIEYELKDFPSGHSSFFLVKRLKR